MATKQKIPKVCEVTCIDLDCSVWVCLKHSKKLTRDTLTGDFLKCTECTEEDIKIRGDMNLLSGKHNG